MDNLQCATREQGSWKIFVLSGRLDRINADETGKQGDELLAAQDRLAVDLSGLEYISSAGLRILLRLAKGAKAAGKSFVLCGATGFVQEVLEDSNMDVLVDMYADASQLPENG